MKKSSKIIAGSLAVLMLAAHRLHADRWRVFHRQQQQPRRVRILSCKPTDTHLRRRRIL